MSTTAPNQTNQHKSVGRLSILDMRQKKQAGEPITMLTAYDYPTALAVDQTGIDMILVGDSLGMVVLGYENTLPVTMDEMIHHCKAVARGASHALLVGDMPFMSYQVSVQDAVRNAGRFLQEGGMQAVKLEGGRERADAVRAIIGSGIPVMGHLGLTPQSVSQLGGFKPQGRTLETAKRLVEDAQILQDEGCFSLVLEAVPGPLAGWISERLDIPTIGIGAGSACDGQVLVLHDLLGIFDRFTPRFVRRYAELRQEMQRAILEYRDDVLSGKFPAQEHTFDMPSDTWQEFLTTMDE